jgi:hypothetical protein
VIDPIIPVVAKADEPLKVVGSGAPNVRFPLPDTYTSSAGLPNAAVLIKPEKVNGLLSPLLTKLAIAACKGTAGLGIIETVDEPPPPPHPTNTKNNAEIVILRINYLACLNHLGIHFLKIQKSSDSTRDTMILVVIGK